MSVQGLRPPLVRSPRGRSPLPSPRGEGANCDTEVDLPGEIDFGVKKVYKSPKSIHRADAKGLTSSSKLSVSCVLTLQTLPLITFTPSYALRASLPLRGILYYISLRDFPSGREDTYTPKGFTHLPQGRWSKRASWLSTTILEPASSLHPYRISFGTLVP